MKAKPKLEKPLSEVLKDLIQDLSLEEREFELMHPKKSKAIEKLMKLGEAVIEPLIEAFDDADAEARGWIIYLLGELMDRGALFPILRYLNVDEEKIRDMGADALSNFDSREIKRLIKAAKEIEPRADSEHSPTADAPIRDGIEDPFVM
jgi:HEAT repeat protein